MVYYKAGIIVISWNVICSQLDIAKKKILIGVKQQSLSHSQVKTDILVKG